MSHSHKAGINIIDQMLPYVNRLDQRKESDIDLIVLHCTELPTLRKAREFGERILYKGSKTGASGHYYIDRDGAIYRYVTDNRIAHHVVGYNERSIGIELVNQGRYPYWFHADHQEMSEPYEDALIDSLIDLLHHLCSEFPRVKMVAAHADLDQRKIPAEDKPKVKVHRRLDPGPQFPWQRVLDRIALERFGPDLVAKGDCS